MGGARSSSGLVTALATLLFLLPLSIWLRYSGRIVSAGGLYAFVEAAAGTLLARIQAALWILSYALYLVYTGPYIVYDLLPATFPGITPYQPALVVLLALLVATILMSTLTVTLLVVAAVALVQVLVTIALALASLARYGASVGAFTGHGDFPAVASATAGVSLLYICASLPLFLGGEVGGGSRRVRDGLGWGFAAVAALVILAAIPIAAAPSALLEAPVPGVALAGALAGPGFKTLVGIAAAISALGLILAEFLALSRLLSVLTRRPPELLVRALAALLVVASLVVLIDPSRVYPLLLRPSLIALWLSQLVVVAVYPWFEARHGKLALGDLGLAAGSSALMLYGLYSSAINPLGT